MKYSKLLVVALAAGLGGCSLISTTTDTTAQIAEGITAATAATSDGTTGLSESGGADTARATEFVESQLVYLRRDAATGSGEHLQAFAELMGEQDPAEFGRWAQRNYAPLFNKKRSSAQFVAFVASQRG